MRVYSQHGDKFSQKWVVTTSVLIMKYKNILLIQYSDEFVNSILQPAKYYKIHISVDPHAVPVFRKFYRIPYSLEKKVKQSLNQRF